jgi:hypothetical protein
MEIEKRKGLGTLMVRRGTSYKKREGEPWKEGNIETLL